MAYNRGIKTMRTKEPVKIKSFMYSGNKYKYIGLLSSIVNFNSTTYIEGFGGSLSYLLNKPQHAKEITYEKDIAVYNLLVHLKAKSYNLIKRLLQTDATIKTFNTAKESKKLLLEKSNLSEQEQLNLAVYSYITYQQSRANMGDIFDLHRTNQDSYINNIMGLVEATNRLKNVQIYNEDILEVLSNNTYSEDTCIFLDPPYCGCEKGIYENELTEEEHKKLIEIVKDSKAKVVITNYENELYDSLLVYGKWKKLVYKEHINRRNSKITNEVIYYNY